MAKANTLKTFNTGGHIPAQRTVLLTESQASARAHNLALVGKKRADRSEYETLAPVYFKASETIGIKGDIDRRMAVLFAEPEAADDTADAEGSKKAGEKSTKVDLAAAQKAQAAAEKTTADLHKLLGALADDLATANALLDTAETAKADLAADAEAPALAAAEKAIADADELVAGVEGQIAAFLANFRTAKDEAK